MYKRRQYKKKSTYFNLCNPQKASFLEAEVNHLLSKGLVSIKPMRVIKKYSLLGVLYK